MEMYFFARFHARPGCEAALAAAMQEVMEPSRAEPGCLAIHAYRATHDPRLFYIHSRWRDEAAFQAHDALPHTIAFVARVEPLLDHPFDTAHTERIA